MIEDIVFIEIILSINNSIFITSSLRFQTRINISFEFDTLSRTDQLLLNQGDILRYFVRQVDEGIVYGYASLVVTKVQ
ncbi:hypothetical protein COL05_04065 [Bacillus sp. AFS059628]|nr:hypothetical protein COL05_04065 [Bacillus sp. AFS059628]